MCVKSQSKRYTKTLRNSRIIYNDSLTLDHLLVSSREQEKVLLWVSNFKEASFLGSSMASTSRDLDGIDMLLNNAIDHNSTQFNEGSLIFYEAILRIGFKAF